MQSNKTKTGIVYYAYPFTGVSEHVHKKYKEAYKILSEDCSQFGTPVTTIEELKSSIKNIPDGAVVILDNLSHLQSVIKHTAEELFSKSPDGASWKEVQKQQYLDILNIPRGAGYNYYRKAFEIIINAIFTKASKVVIVCGVKEKYPDGTELFRKYIQYEPDLVNGCLDILLQKCHTLAFVKQTKEETGLLAVLNHYEGYLSGSDLLIGRNNLYLSDNSEI